MDCGRVVRTPHPSLPRHPSMTSVILRSRQLQGITTPQDFFRPLEPAGHRPAFHGLRTCRPHAAPIITPPSLDDLRAPSLAATPRYHHTPRFLSTTGACGSQTRIPWTADVSSARRTHHYPAIPR